MDFKFPELDPTKTITYVVHADDTTNAAAAPYDMILGMDLMTEIGIYVNTDDKIVVWKDRTIPLKERGALQDSNDVQQLYHMAVTPPVIQRAEERQRTILDADYSQVDIDGLSKS